jgi:hypothetical protein
MYTRNYPEIWKALHGNWSGSVKTLIDVLINIFRTRTFELLSKSYTSITPEATATYLGLPVTEAVKCMFSVHFSRHSSFFLCLASFSSTNSLYTVRCDNKRMGTRHRCKNVETQNHWTKDSEQCGNRDTSLSHWICCALRKEIITFVFYSYTFLFTLVLCSPALPLSRSSFFVTLLNEKINHACYKINQICNLLQMYSTCEIQRPSMTWRVP